ITEKLDARDPNVAAVKARAAIARGRYAQAETMLRPLASRLTSSESALALGLLEQMLGRPSAQATLEKVAVVAETSDDPYVLARAARARREPVVCRRVRVRVAPGRRRRTSRRGTRSPRQGARDQSVQPRRARASGRGRVRRGQAVRLRGGGGEDPRDLGERR